MKWTKFELVHCSFICCISRFQFGMFVLFNYFVCLLFFGKESNVVFAFLSPSLLSFVSCLSLPILLFFFSLLLYIYLSPLPTLTHYISLSPS